MVNTTPKSEGEWTPEGKIDRRDFLRKSLTWWVALAAVGILWFNTIPILAEKLEEDAKNTKALKIKETQVAPELKDFETSINVATENLLDAYETLEFDVAEKYFTDNYNKSRLSPIFRLMLLLNEINMSWSLMINDNIKQRMNNALFKYSQIGSWDSSTFEAILVSRSYLFAKKYPQLAPVIEEWKKKNWK